MKTKLLFLILLIVGLSCGTNNKPPSDADKEKIKGEVKEVVNAFVKGCEEVNFDMVTESFLDSPEFGYIPNGRTFSYKELMAMRPNYDVILNQKITLVNEKYTVLDNSTVIYSSDSKCVTNYKDGHSTLYDPDAFMFIFKKIDSKWKVIYYVESYVEQTIKFKEPSKELNQVELMKQNIGNWKCNIAKDTTAKWDAKSFGTGLEGNMKYVTKGKIVLEGKGLYGYDKNLDKFIIAGLTKGEDIGIYAFWFTSNSKYELVPYSDLSNPANASFTVEGEFISPDMIVETTIMNNKPVKTDTWTRVK